MTIQIRTAVHDTPEYWQTVALRRRLLRTPLGMDFNHDDLMAENDDIHLAAWRGDEVLGTVILSLPDEEGRAHLRQMAVAPEAQGSGIGAKLVAELEQIAIRHGWTEIVLDARGTAIPFYEKQGYSEEGPVYIGTPTGLPHIKMHKRL